LRKISKKLLVVKVLKRKRRQKLKSSKRLHLLHLKRELQYQPKKEQLQLLLLKNKRQRQLQRRLHQPLQLQLRRKDGALLILLDLNSLLKVVPHHPVEGRKTLPLPWRPTLNQSLKLQTLSTVAKRMFRSTKITLTLSN
jgi:hypothetical protein